MNIDLGKDVVCCSHCRRPIALPQESPLGRFQGFDSHYTAEWPADFLCPACGQVFPCTEATMDDETPVRGLPSQIPDLLRVAYEAARENSVIEKIVYATCPKDVDPRTETPRLLNRLPNVTRILSIHVSPYQP
jgi:hypothetical protein